MNIEFDTSIHNVRTVSEDKNYWFTRTFSGITFDDFRNNNYIGIGFNNVPQALIQEVQGENISASLDRLKHFIANNTSYEGGEVTKWANQLVAFQHEMNIGDFVIIPNKGSEVLAIGEIVSDVYIVEDHRRFQFGENYEPYPEKRRRINWLVTKKREEFKGDLNSLFHSRQAIYNVNDLAEVIEGHVSSLFMIGNVGHMVIQIKQDESINAFAFSKFLNSLTYFYHEICLEKGIEIDEELYIKIKVQSKGKLALKAFAVVGIVGLATIFALSDNPEIKIDLGKYGTFDAKGDGFLKSWSNFLDAKQKRKENMIEFQASMDSLKASTKDSPDNEPLNDGEGSGEGEQAQ